MSRTDASGGDVSPGYGRSSDPSWVTPYPALYSMERSAGKVSDDPKDDFHLTSEIYDKSSIIDTAIDKWSGPRFRLLQIQPGTSNQPVRCNLVTRPVFDAPPYIALSYAWGTGPRSEEVFIGRLACPMPVSQHLWKALQRLRDAQEVTTIWVDAICINQQNVVERAAQVQIMAQIYNQASEVRIWFGDGGSTDASSMGDVELVWNLCQQQNPWWERLWVLQECAYARECPVVMIGNSSMSLEQLIERWTAVSELYHALDDQGPYKRLVTTLASLRMPFDTWKVQIERLQHRLPLLHRLRETAGRGCTDPRDQVYAILSLVSEHDASQIPPDYRIAYADLRLKVIDLLTQSPSWDSARDGHLLPLEPSMLQPLKIDWTFDMLPSALDKASRAGKTEAVELLLTTALYGSRELDDIALYSAASGGQSQLVQLLLLKGANINAKGGQYGSPLQAAVVQGHIETVRLLLEEGANINVRGGFYDNVLEAAMMRQHTNIVELLLDEHATYEFNGDIYSSALHVASLTGHATMVPLLLKKSANVELINDGQESILNAALKKKKNNTDSKKLNINRGTKHDGRLLALGEAWDRDEIDLVQLLFEMAALS